MTTYSPDPGGPRPWSHVHAGDTILGADMQSWGVWSITGTAVGKYRVQLYRHGEMVDGEVDATSQVTVMVASDVSAERQAAQNLISGGLGPVEIISESITTGE